MAPNLSTLIPERRHGASMQARERESGKTNEKKNERDGENEEDEEKNESLCSVRIHMTLHFPFENGFLFFILSLIHPFIHSAFCTHIHNDEDDGNGGGSTSTSTSKLKILITFSAAMNGRANELPD